MGTVKIEKSNSLLIPSSRDSGTAGIFCIPASGISPPKNQTALHNQMVTI